MTKREYVFNYEKLGLVGKDNVSKQYIKSLENHIQLLTELKTCKGCEYEYYTVGNLLVCKKMEFNDKCIRHPDLTDWYKGKQ